MSARFRARLALVSMLAVWIVPAAHAWQPETRVQIVDQAVRFMPSSLSRALGTYRRPLLEGMLRPLVDEDRPEHRPNRAGGTLDVSVEEEAQALRRAIESGASFPEIARQFGRLAHFVADAGFPQGTEPGAGKRFEHFSRFCQSRLPKFPLVFYGHEEPSLARADYGAFARTIQERAAEEDVELARAYLAAGDPPDPAAFTDRSVPFAVGSLSYSQAVTDVVRIWVDVWSRAGGDVGLTPYLPPPTERGPEP